MSEGLFFRSVGQKAEVTDSHEAVGQHVKKKSTDKFLGIQEEGLFSIAIFSISIAQGDFSFFDLEDPVIGKRHAMSVATEVIEHGCEASRKAFSHRRSSSFWRMLWLLGCCKEFSSLDVVLEQSQETFPERPGLKL